MSFLVALALAAASPSFDCARARTADEKAICADHALAEADALMARLYDKAKVSAFGSGPSNMVADQARWLRERTCAPSAALTRQECLRSAYATRNVELATAIALREPETALPVLRKLDPEGAPLVEAVALAASRPAGAPWSAIAGVRPRIAAVLAPYANRLFGTDEWGYGRDILSSDGVVSLDSALASEKKFAAFIQIASAYLTEGVVTPHVVPCEAMVRHPGLLAMTGPVFGSTIDNFIVTTDCAAMLPPMPALERLEAAIRKGWPQCEGTIRFSAYRSYGLALDEARIGTGTAGKRAAVMPSRRGVPKALVDAAIRELAASYARYGRAQGGAAAGLARANVAVVLNAAHNCND